MKTLIIIILIILCLIIIKKHIEPFITLADYEDMLSKDEDLKRAYLNKMAQDDKYILDKYRELNDLKNYIKNNQFNVIKSNLEAIKKQYNDTKIKLERLIFNKYKTNSINFYEYNNEFKQKLMSFINDINTHEVTDYGNTDPTCTESGSVQWKFTDNDNISSIKTLDDNLMNDNRCCKKETITKCKTKYKEELNKINQQKLVLQNKDQVLELNKYKYDLYIINVNGGYLTHTTDIKNNDLNNIGNLLFRVVKIDNLNHLNNFLQNKLNYTDVEFPLNIIYKEPQSQSEIHCITLNNKQLSLQELNKDIIKDQIFYKK